jgi:hypothetical protein
MAANHIRHQRTDAIAAAALQQQDVRPQGGGRLDEQVQPAHSAFAGAAHFPRHSVAECNAPGASRRTRSAI